VDGSIKDKGYLQAAQGMSLWGAKKRKRIATSIPEGNVGGLKKQNHPE